MKHVVAILVTLVVAAREISAFLTQKPAFVKTCFLSEPDFPTCNKETVQLIFSSLKDGVPEIGLIPTDPLNVTEIKLLQGAGPVSINATLNNVRVYGFSKAIVKSNKVYPQRGYSFVTKIRIPHMRIEGDYNLRGRILLLPLVGKGSCWFEPRNMDAEVTHEIKISQKDGYNFFNITAIHVKYEIEGLKLRLNNLFNGARALEDSTNAYLNANWKAASDSLKPILSRTIGDILIVILRQLFDNIPANFFIGDVVYQGAFGEDTRKYLRAENFLHVPFSPRRARIYRSHQKPRYANIEMPWPLIYVCMQLDSCGVDPMISQYCA